MTDTFRAVTAAPYLCRTAWVEVFPAEWNNELRYWSTDYDRPRLVGIDTGMPADSTPQQLVDAAEEALALAGWRPRAVDGVRDAWGQETGTHVRFVERIPPVPGAPAYPEPEDGTLRRDGDRWLSHMPRVCRHPSPAYITAAAARRLLVHGYDVALPDGYTRQVLERIVELTGSASTDGVIVSDRQARELGEIARVLAEQHAEHLELWDHGDEAHGVTAVLRALETGHG